MKRLLTGIMVLSVALLGAATVDMVAVLDLEALMQHPQFQEIKKKTVDKADKPADKSFYELLTVDDGLPPGLQGSRILFCGSMATKDGVLIVDTPDGNAGPLMDELRRNLLTGDVKEVTVGGNSGFTGTLADGTEVTILRISTKQLQFARKGGFTLPFQLAKVNKQLLLAAQKKAILSLTCVPAKEALQQYAQTMPFLQTLKTISFSIEGTRPEATASLVGDFQDPQSAQMAKMMADMMLAMLAPPSGTQQPGGNQMSFLSKLKSGVDGVSCSYSLVLDKEVIALLEGYGETLSGFGGGIPQTQPQTQPQGPRRQR